MLQGQKRIQETREKNRSHAVQIHKKQEINRCGEVFNQMLIQRVKTSQTVHIYSKYKYCKEGKPSRKLAREKLESEDKPKNIKNLRTL